MGLRVVRAIQAVVCETPVKRLLKAAWKSNSIVRGDCGYVGMTADDILEKKFTKVSLVLLTLKPYLHCPSLHVVRQVVRTGTDVSLGIGLQRAI